jgi:cytochrome c
MRGVLVILTLLAACRFEERGSAVPPPSSDGVVSYGIGHAATAAEVAAFDSDVSPSGAGLPAGRGDARRGAALYRAQCASCHGEKGEGLAPNPALVGREPREGFPFGVDPSLVRTVGNYWPYATTLFDYIRRTMPLSAPGSLPDDDVYSLTAYLLAANEVIAAGASLDSASLVAVRMPARDRFVPDDRAGGRSVR